MYRKWEPRLLDLYMSHVDRKNVGITYNWKLQTWRSVVEGANFHEDESFTRTEATICFYLSKFQVVDYKKSKVL